MINIRTHIMAFVQIVVSILTTLAIAVFVHLYSLLQANFLQYGHKIQMDILPVPTLFYARYSFCGYLLPLILISGFFFRKSGLESQGLKTEMFTKTVGLLALMWLLGCLLAWQLPFYYPVAAIK